MLDFIDNSELKTQAKKYMKARNRLFNTGCLAEPPRDVIDVSLPMVNTIYEKWIPKSEQIFHEVCAANRVTSLELKSNRRERRIVLARQELMWRLKNETPLSLPQIGRKINRDHTTILYGARRHQQRLDAANEVGA